MPADLAYTRYTPPTTPAYLKSVANALERREPQLWARFAGDEARTAAADGLRLELLKRAYRLEADAHGPVLAIAAEIAAAMGVDLPTHLYQSEFGAVAAAERNAELFYEPDAVHIVFSGDMLDGFTEAELRFVIAHEIAHHALWSEEDGRYWAAWRFLDWASREPERHNSWAETARLNRLHTEIFADRYGLWAIGDLDPSLTAQIKLSTGLKDASGAAYLAQAEEALQAEADAARAEGQTHPEGYLRAVLLAAWAHEPAGAEARARSLINGAPPLDALDILGQEHVAHLTHWMITACLDEPWRQREAIRNHARLISAELGPALERVRVERDDENDRLRAAIIACHPSVQDYFAYVLLDFATVDPRLDDVMLAVALSFAEDFGLAGAFKPLVAKELKITRTKLAEIERNAEAIITRAALSLGAPEGELFASPTSTAEERQPQGRRAAGDAA